MKKTTTWYEAFVAFGKIIPKEVERETEKFVWINGHKTSKHTEDFPLFRTWGEARNHIIQHKEAENFRLLLQLGKNKDRIEELRKMEKL